MKKNFFILLCLLIPFFSCTTDERPLKERLLNLNCEKTVVIDNDRFKSADSGYFEINYAKIVGDCLEVSISASGCSGETWKVELIDSGKITEDPAIKRDLKISLRSSELCEAMVTQTYSFDLEPIQADGNEIFLNLENWEDQLKYEY